MHAHRLQSTGPGVAAVVLATCTLFLTACGGGAPALTTTPPPLQASFGSPTNPLPATSGPVDIRVFNYSNALILDMGLRPLGSTQPYQGGLQGHNPATFGLPQSGGVHWVTVPQGGYEIFLETDRGRIDLVGYTPTVRLPDGTTVPGPAHLYLFSFDTAGRPPFGNGSQ